MEQSRREFVKAAAAAIAATPLSALGESPSRAAWRKTWDAALAVLEGNVKHVPAYPEKVLFEGSTYQGAWQECGPYESLVYASLAKHVKPREDGLSAVDVARNTHRAFFALQREDGQLPASVKLSDVGFAQIQMVTPIAATAWEVAKIAKDEALLTDAYAACSRWDAWLLRYRNTRGTGLVEAFCTYDTGQDNSPRWAGVPNRCADGDAKKCPPGAGTPRLCPDLSATVYGGRIALAGMAQALGKRAEAERWKSEAENLRLRLLKTLWCEEDASFYDLGTDGKFVRVRSVANSRILAEHVLHLDNTHERKMFEAMWNRQLHNPKAFWAKYPLTSIAQDDPAFVHPIPRNSWGGATQALTALRTLRWMEHYGQGAAQRELMRAWCEAILRQGELCQQMDPQTGIFTKPDPGGYSPTALVFLAFAERLGMAPTQP